MLKHSSLFLQFERQLCQAPALLLLLQERSFCPSESTPAAATALTQVRAGELSPSQLEMQFFQL